MRTIKIWNDYYHANDNIVIDEIVSVTDIIKDSMSSYYFRMYLRGNKFILFGLKNEGNYTYRFSTLDELTDVNKRIISAINEYKSLPNQL